MRRITRLTQFVTLIGALLLLAGGIALSFYVDRSNEVQRLSELSAQAHILAATATAALDFRDHQAGQEYVDALSVNPQIAAAGLYDLNGKLFVSYNRQSPAALPAFLPHAAVPRAANGLLNVLAPVEQGSNLVGFVLLQTPKEPLAVRIQRYGPITLLLTMAALMVGILGFAQVALRRANIALASRGQQLAAANRNLEEEIAQREHAEAALRQAQKMEAVGQLTGGIAHDFNNLLAGISGSLELLEGRVAQGRLGGVERYINAAQNSAKRAAALTQRLLAFSRRQTLDPKPTDINRLIASMDDLIRRTIGPSVALEVVGAGGLWLAKIDPSQLENALLNLSINARDAMPDGGRITIETANKWLDERAAKARALPPGQYISVCVTDTGTGMPPDIIARAFDPFFTTKPIGQGTGLGLSMIHGFVRQSGGEVRIYSELGKGTTMCLYFPRSAGEWADAEAQEARHAPDAAQGETVLVIDDEATVRMLIVEVLEDAGYVALEAEDGASGLKILQSNAVIDLLITDVGLPGGMNGRQVADAARVTRPDLKILFVTGYAENAAVGNGYLDIGMEVITKPFAMAALGNKVKEMIEG